MMNRKFYIIEAQDVNYCDKHVEQFLNTNKHGRYENGVYFKFLTYSGKSTGLRQVVEPGIG
jgi:hypothetical protein